MQQAAVHAHTGVFSSRFSKRPRMPATMTSRELAAMRALAFPPPPVPPPPPLPRAERAAGYYAADVAQLEALAASGAASAASVELALRARALPAGVAPGPAGALWRVPATALAPPLAPRCPARRPQRTKRRLKSCAG